MTVLEKALSYATDLGLSVFPVHGVLPDGSCTCGRKPCPNTGKHPVPFDGFKAATIDSGVIRKLFRNRAYNIGIATGSISNVFIVDVDGMEGEESLSQLITQHGALPPTLTSITGRGRHLVFRHPGVKIVNRSNKLGNKLDIRGDGGYIVAPPSIHATGVVYEWDAEQGHVIADAPEWLVGLVKEQAKQVHTARLLPINDNDSDILSALSAIDPDATYDDWIAVGMALADAGQPFGVFDNWSAGGSKYQGTKDTETHWRSFKQGGGITSATLFHMAMLAGWEQDSTSAEDDHFVALGRAAAKNLFQKTKVTPVQHVTIPQHPALPSIITDTVEWIVSTAQKPQPELALLNTLTALGAIFGRRFASPLDTRTNIYMVGLAGTASGKNHSKKCIKALMAEAGLLGFLGGEQIISGAGLLKEISQQPSQIMHFDEFGMILESIMDKRGASHMKVASRIMTELYSSSGERYIGGQYADTKMERTIIANPNLCIFGISTMEKYTSALNRDVVSSGELNRFIVFKAPNDTPKRVRGVHAQKPPHWLVSAWKAIKPNTLNNGMIELDTALVTWPDLQDRIDDMGDFEDEMIHKNQAGAGALWGRYRENSIKIAMIIAISRDQFNPIITASDLDAAESLVQQSINFMIKMVSEHMADSQHEKDCNELYAIIDKNGPKLSKEKLCQLSRRMDAKQRDSALASLTDQNKIRITTDEKEYIASGSRGRKPTYYSVR